jgi:hypothetical protein
MSMTNPGTSKIADFRRTMYERELGPMTADAALNEALGYEAGPKACGPFDSHLIAHQRKYMRMRSRPTVHPLRSQRKWRWPNNGV